MTLPGMLRLLVLSMIWRSFYIFFKVVVLIALVAWCWTTFLERLPRLQALA